MIMYPAGAEIVNMGSHDKEYRGDQQPELVLVKDLFENQETETGQENQERKGAVMVLFKPVIKRPGPDEESQYNHPHFKSDIIDDVDSKKGETAHEQGEEGTMNGTGQRGPDTQCIPVDPEFHEGVKNNKKQRCCKI